jgi:hypothetical protein
MTTIEPTLELGLLLEDIEIERGKRRIKKTQFKPGHKYVGPEKG